MEAAKEAGVGTRASTTAGGDWGDPKTAPSKNRLEDTAVEEDNVI
jgi:hypothetical protein